MWNPHGRPVEAHVEALVRLSEHAVFAPGAGARGVHGHLVANSQTLDAIPHRRNHAQHLVPKGHRLADAYRAEPAMQVVVQIGSAESAIRDAHLHLAPAWLRGGFHGVDAQIPLCMHDHRLHFLGALITLIRSSPRASRLTFSATVAVRRAMVPVVQPDICGVIVTLGRVWNGCFDGIGLGVSADG